MTVYATGDIHGNVQPIIARIRIAGVGEGDTMILLGDNGLNFHGYEIDNGKKNGLVRKTKCDYFVIRGNHDERPEDVLILPENMVAVTGNYNGEYIPYAHYETYFGNRVMVEDKYPQIKYAIDGLIYDINGYKTMVIGGGYSVDKFYRLQNNWHWVENEMLSENEMETIWSNFESNHVDIILSHVAPRAFEPWVRKTFADEWNLPTWFSVDHTMENWMDKFLWSRNNEIVLWYFAHYHADFNCGDIGVMLFEEIIPFGERITHEEE